MTLRVGFAGTPTLAVIALAAIADSGFSVPLVFTRPDKPKGRGLKVEPSPVKVEALRRGLPVLEPAALGTADAAAGALRVPLDVLVVAAYGLILPPTVLAWPRHGCLNIHASLLPRWRGAAPIQRAIEAGDAESGVTVVQMDPGLDTGPMIERRPVAITARETAGTLHDKLAAAGAQVIVDVLRRLEAGVRLESAPQPAEGATYAPKIGRDEACIDWAAEAELIERRVRAFDPSPGAFTRLEDKVVKIWRAEPRRSTSSAVPGTVLEAVPSGIDVACGSGTLRVLELQPAGSRRMNASAAVAGRFVQQGAQFAA